jgi:hypothetical protein
LGTNYRVNIRDVTAAHHLGLVTPFAHHDRRPRNFFEAILHDVLPAAAGDVVHHPEGGNYVIGVFKICDSCSIVQIFSW